jgi:hypothetical protein
MQSRIIFGDAAKTILIGGSIMGGLGYILPDRSSLYGVSLSGFFMAYVVFVIVMSWPRQKPAKAFLLAVITLLMSLWASISLRGFCLVFSGLSECSANKIGALTLANFFFPALLASVAWFPYNSTRK